MYSKYDQDLSHEPERAEKEWLVKVVAEYEITIKACTQEMAHDCALAIAVPRFGNAYLTKTTVTSREWKEGRE